MKDKIQAGTMLKVLLLEDSKSDAELILELLRDAGYSLESKVTASEKEFESLLFRPKFDVILSDFSLPGFDAFGALNLCNDICPKIPFICVSGSIGEETAIELLKAGAVDYILKDRLDRLPFAVKRALDDAKEKLARKQAEEDLKDSEQSYRILANSGQALIWTSGRDKLCNYFNSVWLEFTGRSLEQELGSGWTEGVHPDDLQFCLNTYIEAFERREKFSMEYRVKRFDGQYRWIRDDGSPRYNIKGDFAGYIGHCLDITERKLSEEALIESEEKYRALVENALEGIVILDMEGTIIFGNEALLRIFEIPDVIMIYGKKVFDFMAPESIKQAEEDFINVISGIDSYVSQYECYTSSGKQIWIESIGKQILYEGKPADIISLRDITERKIAEAAIIASEQKYRELFENSLMGISEADLSGRLVNVNQAYAEMYGYDNPEELMKAIPNVVQLYAHPEERQEVLTILGNQGFMEPREIELIKRGGSHFFVLVSAKGIKDSKGKLVSYQASHIDITKRKKAEEELRDVNDKLIRAQRVAHIGSWEDYLPTNELTWSDEMYNIMGIPLGTPLNLFDATKIFPTEELERFQIAVSSAINDNTPYHMDYKIILPDGSIRYIHDEGEVIRDENGAATWMFGTTQDITERILADKTLQDIIDKNPMSIQIVDPNGYTLKTNPANTKLFGAIPPPDFSIFDDIQSKSKELEELIMLAKSGEVIQLPDIYYNPRDAVPTAPDNPKWIRAIIFPLIDNQGKPERFVLMHEDITERKNAEESLKEKAEQLQRFNDLMVGREIKMVDLKREINKLYERLGEQEKYVVHGEQ